MRLTEVQFDSATPIDSYGPGFFRIAGQVLRGPVLVQAGGAASWGGPDDVATLTALAGRVDVLFVGTGARMMPLPAAFRAALADAGFGVEPMATPAACRTYNVLLAEGRRIAAALLPVEGDRSA